ncbi:hypothetical protein D3C81_1492070 [compost metagenome]
MRAQVIERQFLRHLFLHQRVDAFQSGDIGLGPARHGRGRRPQCPQLLRQQAEHADMHGQRVRRAQQRTGVQGAGSRRGRMRQLTRAAVGQQGRQAFRPVARQRFFPHQHAQLRRPLIRLEPALAARVAKRRHRRMAAPETQLFAIARDVGGRAFQADGDHHAARVLML